MTILTLDARILSQAQPFIVSTRLNLPNADLAPLGVATRWVIDPLVSSNAEFFFQLQRLDRLTFGPEGMPMARWVFTNMAELPGFIYGFAIPVTELSTAERVVLEVPAGYRGPVSISMYIAVPTRAAGVWFGHNLASLNSLLPARDLKGLGTLTKVLGLAAFRAETAMGATQWKSKALHIHARLGPLRLLTAWTPAHSIPQSLTYSWPVSSETLRALKVGSPSPHKRPASNRWLAEGDEASMRALQAELERGAEAWLVARPEASPTGGTRLPLLVRAPAE